MPTRIVAGIPPVPTRTPAPVPTPVESPIPAPTPIGRVISPQIEARIPVRTAPIVPRGHIYRGYHYVTPYDSYVIEAGAIYSVEEKCGIVIVIIVGCRTRIIWSVKHRKFALVGAFISVGISVQIGVAAETFQHDAVLRIGLGKHGLYSGAPCLCFGPLYLGLPLFCSGQCLTVVGAVHIVIVTRRRGGIAAGGAACGRYRRESG